MGLNELLGGSPDLGRWFDDHSNAIMQAGFGLATQRGLGGAAGGLVSGTALDTADVAKRNAEKARQQQINGTLEYLKTRYPDLAQAVMNGYPISQAWDEALKRQNPVAGKVSLTDEINQRLDAGKAQGLTGSDLTAYGLTGNLPGSNRSTRAGVGQPITFKNKQTGALVAVEPMSDGTAVDISTGQQVDPSQLVYAPYEGAAAKAGGAGDAKTAVAARTALPGAEQAYKITMNTLANFDPNATSDAAKSVQAGEGEQFSKLIGMPTGQVLPAIPGTNKANFRNIIDQLSGQAFLNIRQALKGAGQVTDFEGAKGEIALSRMKAAADSGDEAAFKQALLDYTQAIDNGMQLLRDQAKGDYAAGQPAITGSDQGSSGGFQVLSVSP